MITGWDKAIFIGVLCLAFIVYIFCFSSIVGEQAETICIFVDGDEYATYRLAEISGRKTVEINTEFGRNVLQITNSGARMLEASCPDKTDIKSGEITKPGQMLVCVPNRVAVRIFGKGNTEVDRVTS